MCPPILTKRDDATIRNQGGSLLIGLIVTLLLLSALGAALLSQTNTATYQTVSANGSDRAFYLAESGYRYAAAKMAAGANLGALHGRTYSLSASEQFALSFTPYIFRVASVSSSWLCAQVPYGNAPVLTHLPGRLKINNGAAQAYDQVQNQGSDQVCFHRSSGNWAAAVGDSVSLVVLSNGTAVTQGGDLNLQSATPADNLPAHNGRFQIDGATYSYMTRDSTRLRGINRVDGAWAPLAPANGDEIVLQPFVQIDSTGIFGQGIMATNRLITYFVPVGTGGAPASEWHESFDTGTANWNSTEGGQKVVDNDGNALSVSGISQSFTGLYESQTNLNWQKAGVDLATAWSDNGGFLDYDAQVKIRSEEPYYLAGISFRLDSSGNSYGLSFLKSAPDGHDGIPNTVIPVNDQLMIVLWERASTNYTNWHWLAYKTLSSSDFGQPTPIFEDDMESGTARWTADPQWGIAANSPPANDPPSPTHCWHGSVPSGGGSNDSLTTQTIDLSTAVAPQLSFYEHHDLYQTWSWWGWQSDTAYVEISTDNGRRWTTLQRYTGGPTSWAKETLDLTSYAGRSNLKIRFRLETLNSYASRDGWYLDDVNVTDQSGRWPTLLVRVREKNASGGTPFAGQRVNDIQAFFGDSNPSGTPDGNPLDNQRLANARGQVNWPPDNVGDTNASDDYFTLVHWDRINPSLTSVALQGSGIEDGTILRSNNPVLTTPTSGSFLPTRPEVGLHAWGVHWVGSNYVTPLRPPVIYYDDFAVRLPGSTGTSGFLPALQQ
jgi:hypothetical protein